MFIWFKLYTQLQMYVLRPIVSKLCTQIKIVLVFCSQKLNNIPFPWVGNTQFNLSQSSSMKVIVWPV